MIRLRLIGASTDLDHLIYSSQKRGRKGSHVVSIDQKLFDTLGDVVRERRERKKAEVAEARAEGARAQSKLPPREVQRLLRAGRPTAQVARLAEVPIEWVEQFLGPVLYERVGMIQESQRALLSKPRLGESGLPLGEAVAANLQARRVEMTKDEIDDSWDARRHNGDPWQISLTFRYRGSERRAMWRYEPGTRTLTPGNRWAADIGWVPGGRKVRLSLDGKAAPARKAAGKPKAKKRAAGTAAKKPRSTSKAKTARKKATSRKPAAKAGKPVSRKAAAKPRKAAAKPRKTPAKPRKTPAKPRKVAARKPAAKARKPVPRKAPARKPSARTRPRRTSVSRRAPAASRRARR